MHPSEFPKSVFVIDHRDEVNVKGPSVLDIYLISRQEGEAYNRFQLLNLCLGDGSNSLPLGELYIMWQVRDIDSNSFFGFYISEECIPLKPLLFNPDPNSWDALLELHLTLMPKLQGLIELAVQALQCDNLPAYLAYFQQKHSVFSVQDLPPGPSDPDVGAVRATAGNAARKNHGLYM